MKQVNKWPGDKDLSLDHILPGKDKWCLASRVKEFIPSYSLEVFSSSVREPYKDSDPLSKNRISLNF